MVRQQLGGDLLNVHGQAATIGGDLRPRSVSNYIGGDLLNVHGQAAIRRGFTKCARSGSNYRRGFTKCPRSGSN